MRLAEVVRRRCSSLDGVRKKFLKASQKGPDAVNAGAMDEYRQAHANSTHTTLMRSLFLEEAIAAASAYFPKPVKKILVVGPGLDMVPTSLGSFMPPPQTYEPVAIEDVAIGSLGAKAGELRIDLVDINQGVIDHLNGGKKGGASQLWLSIPKGKASQTILQFASHIPGVQKKDLGTGSNDQAVVTIPQEAVQNFTPIAGDITADRIGADGDYDVVVMMNTFMYLDEKGKLLALENIARLLKPGGVLVTDILEEEGDDSGPCGALKDNGLHQIKDASPYSYSYFVPGFNMTERKKIVFWRKGPLAGGEGPSKAL